MTLPKGKKLKTQEIESMKIAVEQADIRAIHPDKMEDFAAHMVEKLKQDSWYSGIAPLTGCFFYTTFVKSKENIMKLVELAKEIESG